MDTGCTLYLHVTWDRVTVTVTRTIVPASSHTPSAAAAAAAAASKLGVYGDVQPHAVLPFVVEHAGALGKEAMGFFKECRKKVPNELSDRDAARATWSSWGFSNFYLQLLSVANLKGQGHFFASAAAILRATGAGSGWSGNCCAWKWK